jgi:vancomycin permeability regulator SanA
LLLFLTGIVLLSVIPVVGTYFLTASRRYDATDASAMQRLPVRKVALVFGAGVQPDGVPTPYLKARIETAIKLYEMGKVQHLLMSGDNRKANYNEPVAMQRYAEKRGVDPADITLDYAGYNTYDSCYRARYIFKLREVTVVSQGYHVPRIVLTCSGLGVDTVGVAATRKGRDYTISYIGREVLAVDKALIEIAFKPPATRLGESQPL